MKLIFDTNGNEFEIQVGEFDSLLEIKAKVEEMQGIPIAKQIFTVNGSTLVDDFDLVCHEIDHGSRIHLDIAADPTQEIVVSLKMPEPLYSMNLEVNANGTILQLKEAIQAMAMIPVHRIVTRNRDGVELLDCLKLQEIQGFAKSDVMVEYLPAKSKPPPPPPSSPMAPPKSATVGDKISISVQYRGERMTVEVWAEHKVKELKAKLEKLKLPEYVFTHQRAKNAILKEELSFKEQNVGRGDVIQIFPVVET